MIFLKAKYQCRLNVNKRQESYEIFRNKNKINGSGRILLLVSNCFGDYMRIN